MHNAPAPSARLMVSARLASLHPALRIKGTTSIALIPPGTMSHRDTAACPSSHADPHAVSSNPSCTRPCPPCLPAAAARGVRRPKCDDPPPARVYVQPAQEVAAAASSPDGRIRRDEVRVEQPPSAHQLGLGDRLAPARRRARARWRAARGRDGVGALRRRADAVAVHLWRGVMQDVRALQVSVRNLHPEPPALRCRSRSSSGLRSGPALR